MSLFSALTASVSGMAAQANMLSTISDNIANSSTTGYKQVSTEFEDMLSQISNSEYNAGGVSTTVRNNVTQQGDLTSTTSSTDLAIQGNGFFVVQDGSGAQYLTRAGSFTQNSSGNLVNAAGFTLMGYPLNSSGTTTSTGVNALVPVNINASGLVANPTNSGTFTANLPSNATTVTGTLPSANSAGSTYTDKTSLTTYDDLGNAVNLDIYFTKTGADTWEADVYNAAGAASGGGFPYSAGSLLTTETLNFSGTTGALTSPSTLAFTIPNGQATSIDISNMSQLASSFSVSTDTVNGNAPSSLSSISISTNGTLSEVYANGTQIAAYQIPLANVEAPDRLTSLAGDVYQANSESGSVIVGTATTGGFGNIDSSELESSTVDLASQLTEMIQTQNSYQANSKAFQVGSDLLSELNNLLK